MFDFEALSRSISKLADAVFALADAENKRGQSRPAPCVTVHDLRNMEDRLTMKLDEIKKQIAESRARSQEAFGEISAKIAAQQTKIDELIAAASNPDVTDEAFLADLQSLKATTDQLADIVPDVPPAPTA